ncbi:MAG: hypothetical protein JKX74_08015, partial [Flavobacteriales bacterium]|nr:hypothetical protein [Flavobacteriales bacterium]
MHYSQKQHAMGGGGVILNMIQTMRANKRPRKKMYGSYKAYKNSLDQERAERRIYKYAEASEKHLRNIRRRLQREHKALKQKKVAVLTACVILGVLVMLVMM